jgi:hypothetical protein
MSYPYSSLHLEAHRAKQRLTQAFRDQGSGSLPSPLLEITPATIEQEEADSQPQLSPRVTGSRDVLFDLGTNTECESNSTRRDMSASSFTLALLLFGTIAAAYTDRPAFWLLIGPAPLAVGFAAIAFLRPRQRSCLPALRKRNEQK